MYAAPLVCGVLFGLSLSPSCIPSLGKDIQVYSKRDLYR